jgi:two-component system, NarL family, invasion response regulator UvrY
MSAKTSAARTTAPVSQAIRVAVVDDHELVRDALLRIVEHMVGFEPVFCAGNGEDYIRNCLEHGAPDVAIVDLRMPVMDGWATIAWIRDKQPSTRSVAISHDPMDEHVRRAWQAGANAVLPKSFTKQELHKALSDVHLTGFHRNELVHLRLVQKPVLEMERVKSANEKLEDLSERERETLEWLAHPAWFSVKAIALKMNVESSSVETWCKRIYRKLEVKNRGQAVAFAVEHKLVLR